MNPQVTLGDSYNAQTALKKVFYLYERPNAAESGATVKVTYTINNSKGEVEIPFRKTSDGNDYIGTLDLPRLNLSLPIMSEWSDAKLKITPCRYAGTAYKSGFLIAGHNYRRHFGPLGRIAPGDRVTFTDVDGNVFAYNVAEIQVLKPTAIEDMLSEKWDLSLFTCTLGGQTRLTVRCEKAETGA